MDRYLIIDFKTMEIISANDIEINEESVSGSSKSDKTADFKEDIKEALESAQLMADKSKATFENE